MNDPLDVATLGKERGEFVTPGSELESTLRACEQPTVDGWFVDPIAVGGSRARLFQAGKWTGLTREIPGSASSVVVGFLAFESARGIRVPASFTPEADIKVSLTSEALVLDGPRDGGSRQTLRINRDAVTGLAVEAGPEGRIPSAYDGALAFGLVGAAVAMSRQGKLKRERVGMVVVEIITSEGAVVLVGKRHKSGDLRAALEPLAAQVAASPVEVEAASTDTLMPASSSDAEPVVVTAADEVIAVIEKLGKLHVAGILTDEEFADKKAELMSRL